MSDIQNQKEISNKLLNSQNLTKEESRQLMAWFSENKLPSEQIAMILTSLRMKGETPDEVAGIAEEARSRAIRFPLRAEYPHLVDIVGTGGDGLNTFNISTAAGLVVAGLGELDKGEVAKLNGNKHQAIPKVVKHGNRAVSSLCGSADVLEALGVKIDISKEKMSEMLDYAGMCFIFAPLYHPAMKHVAPVRKAMQARTVFNILGPLVNPSYVPHIVLGVYEKSLLSLMANVLLSMGIKRAIVVHSEIGAGRKADELTLDGTNYIIEIKNGTQSTGIIDAKKYFPHIDNIDRETMYAHLAGGDAKYNANLVEAILSNSIENKEQKEVLHAILALNAGVCMYVSEVCDTIEQGIALANASITSGAAYKVLEKMREF